jgi:hypothetical protein
MSPIAAASARSGLAFPWRVRRTSARVNPCVSSLEALASRLKTYSGENNRREQALSFNESIPRT